MYTYWVEKAVPAYDGTTATFDKVRLKTIIEKRTGFGTIAGARRSALEFLKKNQMYYGGQSSPSYTVFFSKSSFGKVIGKMVAFNSSHISWKGTDSGKSFKVLSTGKITEY